MTRLSDFVDLVRDQILANNGHTTADSDVFAFASPGTDGTYSPPPTPRLQSITSSPAQSASLGQ